VVIPSLRLAVVSLFQAEPHPFVFLRRVGATLLFRISAHQRKSAVKPFCFSINQCNGLNASSGRHKQRSGRQKQKLGRQNQSSGRQKRTSGRHKSAFSRHKKTITPMFSTNLFKID